VAEGRPEEAELAELPGHGKLFLTTAKFLLHVNHVRAEVSIRVESLEGIKSGDDRQSPPLH
jgi:hypothetical protein